MKSLAKMTADEKWAELFCRLARIEDKLEIDEMDEPMPERVRDALREQLAQERPGKDGTETA